MKKLTGHQRALLDNAITSALIHYDYQINSAPTESLRAFWENRRATLTEANAIYRDLTREVSDPHEPSEPHKVSS